MEKKLNIEIVGKIILKFCMLVHLMVYSLGLSEMFPQGIS